MLELQFLELKGYPQIDYCKFRHHLNKEYIIDCY